MLVISDSAFGGLSIGSASACLLIMPEVVPTKEAFDEIINGNAGKLVVVDFTATWCRPCQFIAPKFAEMAEANPEAIFIKVDVDDNDATAAACGIKCMPALQFFKDGQMVHQMEGADEATLRAKVAELMSKVKTKHVQGVDDGSTSPL